MNFVHEICMKVVIFGRTCKKFKEKIHMNSRDFVMVMLQMACTVVSTVKNSRKLLVHVDICRFM